jgi:hypothetical protein
MLRVDDVVDDVFVPPLPEDEQAAIDVIKDHPTSRATAPSRVRRVNTRHLQLVFKG